DGRLRGLLTPGAPVGTAKLVPQPLPALRGSDVHVFVAVNSVGQDDVAALGRAGLTVERVNAEQRLVRGWVSLSHLREVAALGLVRPIPPVRPGGLQVGSVTSEGDAAAQGPQARATGFDGTGVKVGVISDGIDRVASSISSGNLAPGTGVPAGTGCAAGSG